MPNARFTPPFTLTQQKVLALVPKVTAVPSILGSLYIIQHALRSLALRSPSDKRVYHRLLVAMSTMDFIYSVKSFCSTWPIPASTGIYLASGTTQTCTAAGFWGHGAALSSALYNGTLMLYYVWTIVYGWRQERVKRHEYWLHLVPMSLGWSTAIASLPLTLFNPIGWTCWIGPWPLACSGGDDCVRGANATIYRWAFFHAELWLCFVFVAVAVWSIYWKIRRQESVRKKYHYDYASRSGSGSNMALNDGGSSRYEAGSSLSLPAESPIAENMQQEGVQKRSERLKQQKKRLLSRQFAIQAWLYILAFFFAWVFPMVGFAIAEATGQLYYPLLVLTVIFSPLQGFFNALIYIRPRYIRYRQQQRKQSTPSPERPLTVLDVLVRAISVQAQDDEDTMEELETSERLPPSIADNTGLGVIAEDGDDEGEESKRDCDADNCHHNMSIDAVP
jgi:hypothetical protein